MWITLPGACWIPVLTFATTWCNGYIYIYIEFNNGKKLADVLWTWNDGERMRDVNYTNTSRYTYIYVIFSLDVFFQMTFLFRTVNGVKEKQLQKKNTNHNAKPECSHLGKCFDGFSSAAVILLFFIATYTTSTIYGNGSPLFFFVLFFCHFVLSVITRWLFCLI